MKQRPNLCQQGGEIWFKLKAGQGQEQCKTKFNQIVQRDVTACELTKIMSVQAVNWRKIYAPIYS
jgi:hypothetical protein